MRRALFWIEVCVVGGLTMLGFVQLIVSIGRWLWQLR